MNIIELIFQLLGHYLCHSNTRHMSYQMKSDNFFLLKSVGFMENISNEDVIKSYRKCGNSV